MDHMSIIAIIGLITIGLVLFARFCRKFVCKKKVKREEVVVEGGRRVGVEREGDAIVSFEKMWSIGQHLRSADKYVTQDRFVNAEEIVHEHVGVITPPLTSHPDVDLQDTLSSSKTQSKSGPVSGEETSSENCAQGGKSNFDWYKLVRRFAIKKNPRHRSRRPSVNAIFRLPSSKLTQEPQSSDANSYSWPSGL